jgi:hypothetical protein
MPIFSPKNLHFQLLPLISSECSERQTDDCGGIRGPPKNQFGSKSVILSVLQISAVGAIAFYLVRCRASVLRRNRQSWDDLVARLSAGWSVRAFSESFYADPARLSVIYREAQVMQEIAEYTFRNLDDIDQAFIEALHRNATRTRYLALAALARYALNLV